jgi:predicted HD phosphohydrolase
MAADIGIVDHEGIGAQFLLARGFSQKIADLVRAHVAAKRYLVATNATYAAQLSPASTATLKHQGGPMSPAEVAAFESDPLFTTKLRMRSWDEMGKEPDMVTPPLTVYRKMMLRHLS